MNRETITAEQARLFYDRLGAAHDCAAVYEAAARRLAIRRLDLRAGDVVLDLGAGTGRDAEALRRRVVPGGLLVALDISPRMLGLVRARSPLTAGVRADCRALPLSSGSVDSILCAYVLDLIPTADLGGVAAELRRVLRPGGRLVAVSLTDGVTASSRVAMAAWSAVHRRRPGWLGGCRPLRAEPVLRGAGLVVVRRTVVVERAVPSEVLEAVPDAAAPAHSGGSGGQAGEVPDCGAEAPHG